MHLPKRLTDEGGAVPLIILMVAVGLLVFLVLTNTLNFKAGLFGELYPKPSSLAAVTCTKYVATSGSDTSGNGSSSAPYATLNKAQSVAVAGDTICVRAGTYSASKINISRSGTTTAPITFTKDPNSSGAVILDGTGASILAGQAVVLISGNYVTFDGFEIVNSPADGIDSGATNVIIKNNKIHEIKYHAAVLYGSNITFDSNEVYNAAMSNLNDAFGSGGWPAVVSGYYKSDGTPATNINYTNNYIHDSWGEGIAPNYLDGGVVKGNIVKDGFGVLIYLDRAKNMTVDGNYVYMTTDAHNRNGKRPDGIGIATEVHTSGPAVTASNITISNNLILGTHEGINYWNDTRNTNTAENTYSGIKIYYNVIKDTTSTPLHIYAVNSPYPAPGASEFRDNIIYKGGDGTSINLGNSSIWTLSNNDWPNGIPSPDSTTKGSFAADPLFVNPAPEGGPYPAAADGYKLQAGSPAISKGIAVSTNTDYFGATRPPSNTTVGFHQL